MLGLSRCLTRTSIYSVQYRCLSSTSASRIISTQKWFETIVVGEKLCPFAPPFLQNPSLLRIVSSNAGTADEAVHDIAAEVKMLVGQDLPPSHETTLVVLENLPWVADFRDFVRLSWQLQEESIGDAYVEKVQIVLFHPQATHQTYACDSDESNPADYTIRSPFPTVHLLREVDVLRAVQGSYPNLETLPARNQQKLIQQGLEVCQRRFQACYEDGTT